MEDFVILLKKLMIMENGYTEDEANILIKKYPNIIVQGIMRGPFALRAIVMALEMEEEKINVKENNDNGQEKTSCKDSKS